MSWLMGLKHKKVMSQAALHQFSTHVDWHLSQDPLSPLFIDVGALFLILKVSLIQWLGLLLSAWITMAFSKSMMFSILHPVMLLKKAVALTETIKQEEVYQLSTDKPPIDFFLFWHSDITWSGIIWTPLMCPRTITNLGLAGNYMSVVLKAACHWYMLHPWLKHC